MNLPFKIAKRYFFSRSSGGAFNLISIISGISLLGYFIGAAALILVLSVFNGFEGMFQSMYNRFDPELRILPATGKVFEPNKMMPLLQKIEGIDKITFVLEENVLLKYGERQNIATIKGVDENYLRMTELDSCIVAGDLMLQSDEKNYAIVGQGIAWQLGIDPNDYFERLQIFVPKRGETDILNPEGSFVKANILPSAIFSVQEEVDNKIVIVPMRFLRPLLQRETAVSTVECSIKAGADVEKIKKQLAAQTGNNFKIQNRFEQREGFYKVLKSEKLISYIILFFILLVASTNSIGSLYILVMEKKKDIKMLAALGLPTPQIGSVFQWNSFFIAFVGGGLGVLAGIVLTYLQQTYGFVKLNQSGAFISIAYPVELQTSDVLLVCVTVLAIGFMASLYPSFKARRLV